jgi:uncharacterized repeat protein (TIGR03803 family)
VTGNTATTGGGGVQNFSGTTSLKNTIVANNSPSDCAGFFTSLGHNIVSDATGGLTGTGDLNSTDPLLGPLANNDGPTWTHALFPCSPAIDAVPNADCTDASGAPITTDQRGVARPQGAAGDIGSVERLQTTTGTPSFEVLKSFTGLDGANPGANPFAGLIQESAGALYGTTGYGGSSDAGTVFKLTRDGSGGYILTELKHFNGPDGSYPLAGVIQDSLSAGVLYGTTQQGGSSGVGTVFRLTPDLTGGYSHTVLKEFNDPDGSYPAGDVIQDSAGVLYGTTSSGGSSGFGMVFKLTPNGSGGYSHTVLKNFEGSDGAYSYAGLIQDSAGVLYGTTYEGGSSGVRTVFKLTPNGSGGYTHSVLKEFNGSDGSNPYASVIQDSAGVLYGTTVYGGSSGFGTVFKLTPDGSGGYPHSVLKEFNGPDGSSPFFSVIQDSGGALYGTTYDGGSSGFGTVFKLTPDGAGGYAHSVLKEFSGPDGSFPFASVIQDSAGALLGTTSTGGDFGFGTVFRMVLGCPNKPPVAHCQNVTVVADASCSAAASIDAGSSDPDAGDTITLSQSPAGPYPLGDTVVTLRVARQPRCLQRMQRHRDGGGQHAAGDHRMSGKHHSPNRTGPNHLRSGGDLDAADRQRQLHPGQLHLDPHPRRNLSGGHDDRDLHGEGRGDPAEHDPVQFQRDRAGHHAARDRRLPRQPDRECHVAGRSRGYVYPSKRHG